LLTNGAALSGARSTNLGVGVGGGFTNGTGLTNVLP